ncbi:MAG: archaetidylserine decarboxylase [Parachlamydiaceae bacterium]
MKPIIYFDRLSKKQMEEKVYGGKALQFLYGEDLLSRCFGAPLLHLLSRFSFFSSFVGYWQSRAFTKRKIAPFISHHQIEANEFKDKISDFASFNDFFIRELKKESRPLAQSEAIIPADGRYWFYPEISSANFFYVKNKKFNLSSLLKNEELAHRYEHGSMIIARLCPSDYHRFHFPCDCVPHTTELLNGWLYSVNPLALRKNFDILTTNKRTLCCLDTKKFGQVLYLEIGATSVGSIHQTYQPFCPYLKGEEKGYFSFGGSSLILLFEPKSIQFDEDLVQASKEGVEIRCLMGQSMGFPVESA